MMSMTQAAAMLQKTCNGVNTGCWAVLVVEVGGNFTLQIPNQILEENVSAEKSRRQYFRWLTRSYNVEDQGASAQNRKSLSMFHSILTTRICNVLSLRMLGLWGWRCNPNGTSQTSCDFAALRSVSWIPIQAMSTIEWRHQGLG